MRRLHPPLLSILLGLAGCDAAPWLEHRVVLPGGGAAVRVMIRGGGGYRTVVENRFGAVGRAYLPTAGGGRRANLYLAPGNLLVVLDAGGDDAFFEVAPGRAPREVRIGAGVDRDAWSARWRYLGAVVRERRGGLAFHGPEQTPECFAMLGAGESPYRARWQRESHCP